MNQLTGKLKGKVLTGVICAVLVLAGVLLLPPLIRTALAATSGDYEYTVNKDGTTVTITGYTGAGGDITIPDTVTDGANTYTVTAIGDGAFAGKTSIMSVMIPSNVTHIGTGAFSECILLRSAYFLGNAPSADESMFNGCATGFTVYYKSSSTGFSNPWNGYAAVVFNPDVTYTVTFNLNGAIGTEPDAQTLYEGVKAACPADPSYGEKIFSGWYTESACENEWSFDTAVTSGLTLFAQWIDFNGSGTEADPYQVSTPAQLNAVRDYPDACFILMNDIDLSEATSESGEYWNDGAGWEPIQLLDGSFDGNGYRIIGLYLYRPAHKWGHDFVGLFEEIRDSALIENLGLVNSIITSTDYVGGIVGRNFGIVSNCYFTGKINGVDCDSVGGITGWNEGEIIYCYNSGKITADGDPDGCGGITGVGNGAVRECFNSGDITILSYNGHSGGIEGRGNPIIENCYNSGSIYSSHGAGGIIGSEFGIDGATISNCYNVGNIGDASDGGILGIGGYDYSQITNCYYLNNKDAAVGYYDAVEVNVLPKSNEELEQQGTFAGFNFLNKWTMSGDVDYPYPELSAITHVQERKSEVFDIGNGLPYAPYVISTLEQLNEMRNIKGANFILGNNIDLSTATGESGTYYNDGAGWEPIGIQYGSFFGSFDAAGYSITGLLINRPNQDYIGLFGYIGSDAVIKDLRIDTCNIIGHDYTGAIAGYTEGMQLNCDISGSVNGNVYVGGICGKKAKEGVINGCHNSADVSGDDYVGGIVGQIGDSGDSYKGNVSNCSNSGNISGMNYSIGGIAGHLYYGSDSNGDILLCYNTGRVSAKGDGGGIVGTMIVGHINQCYNTGCINGNGDSYHAGICGYASGYISDCFNMGIVDGASYCSGIAGYASGQIVKCYNVGNWPKNMSSDPIVGWPYMGDRTMDCYYLDEIAEENDPEANTHEEMIHQSTFEGFDFTSIWTIEEEEHYPVLQGLPFVYASGLNIEQENIYLREDETVTLNINITPNDASSKGVRWHTSAFNVASVSMDGVVRAKVPGTATISATTTDGDYVDICTVNVVVPVTGVTISISSLDLSIGDTYRLYKTISPTYNVNPNVFWSSNDESVITVVDGIATAVGQGTAIVTVTTEDGGFTDTCLVTVIQPVSSVILSSVGATMKAGETVNVTATVLPSDATYPTVAWSSSDEDVVTVDQTGKVTAVGVGTATITATADGVSGTCEVTVEPATYTVAATTSNASYGTATGGAVYNNGASVTLVATPKAGCRFVCWKSGETQLSVNSRYTFTADADMAITAEFAPIDIPVISAAVSAGYNSIRLTWNAAAGAAGYEIWRATSAAGAYIKVNTATATTYTDANLTAGSIYYYKVKAYCTASTATTYGSLSAYASVTPVPSAPGGTVAAMTGYSSVKVTWNAVAGANGYQLYRATSQNGTYSLIKTTSSLSYTNTSLSTGRTYYYKVRAYRTVGSSKVYGNYSAIVSAKPMLSSVTTPTASAYYPTSIKISWSAVSGRTRYEVWRGTTTDTSKFTRIGTTSSTYYKDTTCTPFVTYYYQIKVYRTVSGQKVYSSSASPTASARPILNNVTGVKAAMSSASSIKISWSSVTGASGYEVLRSTSPDSGFAVIKSTSSRSYTDSNRIPNTKYYYQVRAYRKVGSSRVYSTASAASATPYFGAVTNPKAVRSSSTKIKISWSAVSGRTGYEIWRSTTPDPAGFTLLKSTTSTSYTNSGLTTGVTYYYKIRAYRTVNNTRCYSAFTSVVSAKP